MSRPSETASLLLGHRWAPSIDEVRQGGIDRRLSRAASPHLHPPRRATPSHEEASPPRVSRWVRVARCWASRLAWSCWLAAWGGCKAGAGCSASSGESGEGQGIQEQRLVSVPSSPRASEEQGRSWGAEAPATSRRINTASPLGR